MEPYVYVNHGTEGEEGAHTKSPEFGGQALVCNERTLWSRRLSVRCFNEDEGRPLGVGLQEQASNRLKLRGLRARVVSIEVKRRGVTLSGKVSGDERK